MKIFYGTSEYKIDVTDVCFTKLLHGDIITIPRDDGIRGSIFPDPVPNVVKKIFISLHETREYDDKCKIDINIINKTITTILDYRILTFNFLQSLPRYKCIMRDLTALGHEMHITRIILLDLLCKGFIDKNVNVYTQPDRVFMYSKIFPNVFLSNNLPNDLIDLTKYGIGYNIDSRVNCSQKLVGMGYDNTAPYRTDEFLKLCNTMDLLPIEMNTPFIVIHLRITDDVRTLGVIETANHQSLSDLEKLITWSKKRLPEDGHVIVFSSVNYETQIKNTHQNVIFINNLQLFASYLAHDDCILCVSEWSGAGQLAQYVTKGEIYYYFNYYPPLGYEKNYEEYYSLANSDNATIYTHWDFKKTMDAKVVMFKDFQSLLEY
jgi:hypothetical protein